MILHTDIFQSKMTLWLSNKVITWSTSWLKYLVTKSVSTEKHLMCQYNHDSDWILKPWLVLRGPATAKNDWSVKTLEYLVWVLYGSTHRRIRNILVLLDLITDTSQCITAHLLVPGRQQQTLDYASITHKNYNGATMTYCVQGVESE